MKCKFVVGQKIVCITSNWPTLPEETAPELNKIYTVRELTVDMFGSVLVYLKEIINPKISTNEGFRERAYAAEYFRALKEKPKETSIEVFKKLLTPNTVIKTLEKV